MTPDEITKLRALHARACEDVVMVSSEDADLLERAIEELTADAAPETPPDKPLWRLVKVMNRYFILADRDEELCTALDGIDAGRLVLLVDSANEGRRRNRHAWEIRRRERATALEQYESVVKYLQNATAKVDDVLSDLRMATGIADLVKRDSR